MSLLWTAFFLLVGKLGAYYLELNFTPVSTALNTLGLGFEFVMPHDGPPLLAMMVVGLAFMSVGLFSGWRNLIVAPLIFGVAEAAMFEPVLAQVFDYESVARTGLWVLVGAIVGAFLIADSDEFWQVNRDGRFGMWLRLVPVAALPNIGSYYLCTRPLSEESIGIYFICAAVTLIGLLWYGQKATNADNQHRVGRAAQQSLTLERNAWQEKANRLALQVTDLTAAKTGLEQKLVKWQTVDLDNARLMGELEESRKQVAQLTHELAAPIELRTAA